MCPVLHRLSSIVYLPGPRPLPVGTVGGVAVGLRGSISVFLSGTSSAGADELCGHPCFLPDSMFFLVKSNRRVSLESVLRSRGVLYQREKVSKE